MPSKRDMTPEQALIILQRQRKNNRMSAKLFRERMIAKDYWYYQVWVPREVKDEAKAAVDRIVRKAEAKRDM